MQLTLSWLNAAMTAPAALARLALRQGQAAFSRSHKDEPPTEDAICPLAESFLREGKPAEALYALNTLLLAQDQLDKPRSPRVRLLRGIAGCLLGRPAAARRELGAIPKTQASTDELLAAAQACILCGDAAGASQLLDALHTHPLEPDLAARAALCRAALYFRAGDLLKALDALPPDSACSPQDSLLCPFLRQQLRDNLLSA